jgi:predicted secreted acid phosphatase
MFEQGKVNMLNQLVRNYYNDNYHAEYINSFYGKAWYILVAENPPTFLSKSLDGAIETMQFVNNNC